MTSKGTTKKKINWISSKFKTFGEFLSGPVARTWIFHCRGLGPIPGQGTKILQAVHGVAKKKKKLNKIKNFYTSKYTIKKVKRQPTEWEKIFAVISQIRFYYIEYIKNSYNSTAR